MHVTMAKWTWTKAFQTDLLEALGVDGASTVPFTLDTSLLKFAMNNFADAGRDTAIGAITEADFTGYADVTVGAIGSDTTPLTGPVSLSDDLMGLNLSVTEICTTAPDAPGQTIYGAYLTDPAGAVLWGFEKFAEPVSIVEVGDFIQYDWTPAIPATTVIQ